MPHSYPHVFDTLTPADYTFLTKLIESPFNATDDARLRALLATFEEEASADARTALNRQLVKEIRYLGSSEVAYMARLFSGQEPGVPLAEVIRDVAKAVKIDLPMLGTEDDMLKHLVEAYATREFSRMTPAEQQAMLEELGVEQERAAAFVKKSAGVFALPALIAAFDVIIVQGLIKTIIFGTITKLIGAQLSRQLFAFLAGRFPWWLRWVGPVAWGASLSWAAFDLQGPAQRKTIPVVLYLGLVALR